MPIDRSAADHVDRVWTEVVSVLQDDIEIPNVGGAPEPDADAHGPSEYLQAPTARHPTLAVAELQDADVRRG